MAHPHALPPEGRGGVVSIPFLKGGGEQHGHMHSFFTPLKGGGGDHVHSSSKWGESDGNLHSSYSSLRDRMGMTTSPSSFTGGDMESDGPPPFFRFFFKGWVRGPSAFFF